MLTSEDMSWIESHTKCDPSSLRLRCGSSDSVALHRILQIDCRKKAASKLRDTLRCEGFEFPSALLAEQCTSDRLAAFHAVVAGPQESVADLTAGLGIDVFHLAKVSEKVTAIEINSLAANILADNASVLGLDNITTICGDCVEIFPNLGRFSLLFIDPARRGIQGERVYSISDCHPDIIPMLSEFSRHSHRMLVKLSPMLDISAVEKELSPYVRAVYSVGTRTECKELLVDLDLCSTERMNTVRHAVTLLPDGNDFILEFSRQEEAEAVKDFSTSPPVQGQWLIEPWPAVMKAAPWNIISSRYGLKAIASNSHLYISSLPCDAVGEAFKIIEVIPFSSGNIKRLHKKYPAAGITTRNFPMSPQALRMKLKIKDEGHLRLFATTLDRGEKVMIVVETPYCADT